MNSFCLISWYHFGNALQQQECWSCNFVLKILCNHTMVKYFYGNMCTHNHISLNLWCLLLWIVFFVIWVWSSPCGWDRFCPAISRMNCIFHQICLWYVWMYICIVVIFHIFSYLFICDFLMQHISFFPFFWVLFEKILSKWSRWPIYRYIIYYCVIFCLQILLYTCFVVSWDIFSVSANLFFCCHHNVHLYTFTWQCKAVVT